MKDLFKAPEKIQRSDKKIANLSDAQFKTLVNRMLQDLTGYFNSMKKTQAAMKVALCEVKKTVSYTHLTLPTIVEWCRSRWSPYH